MPYGDDPSLIQSLGPAYISETNADTLVITLKNPAGNQYLASVEGVNSRNAAQALKGTELWYDRDSLPVPEDGQFYYDDLVGLTVLEDGEAIGTVSEVSNFGASDLIEITPKGGVPYYFPFTDESVASVDLNAGTLSVTGSEAFRA